VYAKTYQCEKTQYHNANPSGGTIGPTSNEGIEARLSKSDGNDKQRYELNAPIGFEKTSGDKVKNVPIRTRRTNALVAKS
jgi:hypothetical protein